MAVFSKIEAGERPGVIFRGGERVGDDNAHRHQRQGGAGVVKSVDELGVGGGRGHSIGTMVQVIRQRLKLLTKQAKLSGLLKRRKCFNIQRVQPTCNALIELGSHES